MIYLTVVFIVFVLCCTAVMILYLVCDARDRKTIQNLTDKITTLTAENSTLKQSIASLEQTRGKSFKHSELEQLDDIAATAIGTKIEANRARELLDALNLQLAQTEMRAWENYKLVYAIRGADKNNKAVPPDINGLYTPKDNAKSMPR